MATVPKLSNEDQLRVFSLVKQGKSIEEALAEVQASPTPAAPAPAPTAGKSKAPANPFADDVSDASSASSRRSSGSSPNKPGTLDRLRSSFSNPFAHPKSPPGSPKEKEKEKKSTGKSLFGMLPKSPRAKRRETANKPRSQDSLDLPSSAIVPSLSNEDQLKLFDLLKQNIPLEAAMAQVLIGDIMGDVSGAEEESDTSDGDADAKADSGAAAPAPVAAAAFNPFADPLPTSTAGGDTVGAGAAWASFGNAAAEGKPAETNAKPEASKPSVDVDGLWSSVGAGQDKADATEEEEEEEEEEERKQEED
eukprot:m.12341 g.12341  ORF g.12341 m.12341 type:complete len:307 (+) comp4226_c0_seq1:181-1101(+)